jgi:hypothetical protein
MVSIAIERVTIPYKKELLKQWKQRDPKIVPQFMLGWNGPGISNGYGFGEWMAERYFRDNGLYIFTNDFDLLSISSKYLRYNMMIETMIPPRKLQTFKEVLQVITEKKYAIENPDLFVFNLETCFFAEVKKGKDKLREPQMRFFYLVKKYLGIESKLIYLCDKSAEIIKNELTLIVDLDITENNHTIIDSPM